MNVAVVVVVLVGDSRNASDVVVVDVVVIEVVVADVAEVERRS